MLTAFDNHDDIDFLHELSFVVSENFNHHNSSVGEEHVRSNLAKKTMAALMVETKTGVFEAIQGTSIIRFLLPVPDL
ncbi:hypothetical protein TIFTF001_016214 [Ficus carica]|uniref:Uncharacterized protein n=1 Tax=Ficus carica TaxID=3494 RepID=A0AA88AJ48_FICCA|nr:hypothetical protein TIFTF001_016214 [Ficus carica]